MKKKILFVISEDWYAKSHKFEIIQKAVNLDYITAILFNANKNEKVFDKNNIKIYRWNINRYSFNIFRDISAFFRLIKTIKDFKPDIVQSTGIKPNLYISIVTRLFLNTKFLITFSGLGYLFISNNYLLKSLMFIVKKIFKYFTNHHNSKFIFQNIDDGMIIFGKNYIKNKNILFIPGSGISISKYPEPNNKINNKELVIIMASRMLYSKGVYDYLECANSLYKKGYNYKFILLGIEDPNIDSVNIKDFKNKIINPNFEYISNKRNINEYLKKGDLFCFMSYREGLPKALLEASLFKMPLISYDVPGCREVVINNENGYLVDFNNKDDFQRKIIFIANNPELRKIMGEKARLHVENNFSDKIILNLYKNIWIKD